MHPNNDYRITGATTNNGSANDEGLQPSFPGSGGHGDPSGFSNLSQLLDLTQSLHGRNMQHNATSVSPSSTYYGSGKLGHDARLPFWSAHIDDDPMTASPATIFSPPVKTPMDNTNAATNYHPQNPNEAAFPLFAPAPNPPHSHHNPNVHPGAGVTRFPEFKIPNFNVPADFFHFPPQPPQQQPPPHSVVVAAPNSVQTATANTSGIVPAPSPQQQEVLNATSQDITINDLTAICPPQDAEGLRETHAHFANDIQLQQLHLRLMWKWYTERERPSNDDLLKFHRAHRRSAGHAATKGTGSRGGAEGYTCLWPGCTKQDQPSRSDRAQEHTLLHLGLKPFGCKACGAEFTRHNELKRHDKTCKNKKHTHNLSADDITLPFIVREPVPSSSRRTSFPSTPSSSTRPNANKKARRAVRGVSSDPSSGGNSPSSPLNSSSSSRPPHSMFTSLTVDSHEQPHHTFFDSLPNTTTPNNGNVNNGNSGFNGAQFQPTFQYPFAIPSHGTPLPGTPLPLSLPPSSSPSGYGPTSASTSSSPPRAPYVSMPLSYPYGQSQQPQPQQGFGHPRSPFSFHHPLHNQDPSSSSSPFSPPSDNLDPRSPYPGQSQQRQ